MPKTMWVANGPGKRTAPFRMLVEGFIVNKKRPEVAACGSGAEEVAAAREQGRRTAECRSDPAPRPRPCACPASSASCAKRRFVGMGQALVGHPGSVGATSRHEHCPRVSWAAAPPREPTVGPRAGTRARRW